MLDGLLLLKRIFLDIVLIGWSCPKSKILQFFQGWVFFNLFFFFIRKKVAATAPKLHKSRNKDL